ncbi:MAG: FlgD immunoglobulin-like domain containing protein, partial [Chthoniobacterales bacterium]
MFSLLASAALAAAQTTPAPTVTPAPKIAAKSVLIRFLPPPLDGTFSLGIYDGAGKLVRVLQREADLEEFEAGSDSLSTTWDGKDDAGAALPPGKYHARGYVVDSMDIDGVGYSFNDWVTDDQSLHLKRITALTVENDLPFVTAQLADDTSLSLLCNADGEIAMTGEAR